MLRLMQPTPTLQADHPLLSFDYPDSERWTSSEIEAFQSAIMKFEKDFTSVAQEVRINKLNYSAFSSHIFITHLNLNVLQKIATEKVPRLDIPITYQQIVCAKFSIPNMDFCARLN